MTQPSPVSPDSGCDVLAILDKYAQYFGRSAPPTSNDGMRSAEIDRMRNKIAELIEAADDLLAHSRRGSQKMRLYNALQACRAGETT